MRRQSIPRAAPSLSLAGSQERPSGPLETQERLGKAREKSARPRLRAQTRKVARNFGPNAQKAHKRRARPGRGRRHSALSPPRECRWCNSSPFPVCVIVNMEAFGAGTIYATRRYLLPRTAHPSQLHGKAFYAAIKCHFYQSIFQELRCFSLYELTAIKYQKFYDAHYKTNSTFFYNKIPKIIKNWRKNSNVHDKTRGVYLI
jgi:hypothetical protein